MLIAEKSIALHDVVQQLGFASLEDFALDKAKEELLNDIKICTDNIAKFEKKYGLDYADFCFKFHELGYPLFEKEEDSAEWNVELKQLSNQQKRLASLY